MHVYYMCTCTSCLCKNVLLYVRACVNTQVFCFSPSRFSLSSHQVSPYVMHIVTTPLFPLQTGLRHPGVIGRVVLTGEPGAITYKPRVCLPIQQHQAHVAVSRAAPILSFCLTFPVHGHTST